MQYGRTTLSKFIIEEQRQSAERDEQLTALINDIQTACTFIALAISRGALNPAETPIAEIANEIMLRETEWGGQLCGVSSTSSADPHEIPAVYPRGPFIVNFNALEGAATVDLGLSAGTIFSVVRAPDGVREPAPADFLQAGNRQVAAGFALYGSTATMVLTLGEGVNGFTLDREIGAYTLTHPGMRIPADTRDCAVSSRQRFAEPPIRHYIEECAEGEAGPRKAEFDLRWTGSLAAEAYRILVRGGVAIYPLPSREQGTFGGVHLLHEANPVAMLVEQASGAASTGRQRVLDVQPASLHERVPLVFGAQEEVRRIDGYHEIFDRGESFTLNTPLFNTRSLFRV